jgi:hypothetical protein
MHTGQWEAWAQQSAIHDTLIKIEEERQAEAKIKN